MKRSALAIVVSSTIMLAVLQGDHASAATFQTLGQLDNAGGTVALGVSADGSIVVGVSNSLAFRWTVDDGIVELGNGTARAISADGSTIVGDGSPSSNSEAFRWTSDGGMVGLGFLAEGNSIPTTPFSSASATSVDGSVIVGRSSSISGLEAFRWTAGSGMVGMGDLSGGDFRSAAYGISVDGSVIVGAGSATSYEEAFRWTSVDGMVGLGFLPGTSESRALATSADGSVVVGWSGGRAFRWTQDDGMVAFGNRPGFNATKALATSADGSVIVGTYSTNSSPSGQATFIWDEVRGMRGLREIINADPNLDMTGWALNSANGISADGRTIVGFAFRPGDLEIGLAYITTIPEPTTLAVLSLGVSVLLRRRTH
jgi:probable HAF family extracellular repeat protein